ncbi:substrate-binding domain-containing protein [Solirubrobacter ginsenosidimutans]|uniref:Substrate-binding domain-containing protein n=1 Tax=Solirubrobacter ginsenosidimutans TaxID=490573 RepID=A0A9X3MRF3_9ACTN|nr:substrate-binding domain-containing protein [Solirubrobacter ginsenosidimutans]MDA0159858.1 substrate-binding domain-containing protein [Solirubrobacter ginsenosidimutans]
MGSPTSRSGVVAVLVPVAFDLYFGLVLACVTDAAHEHGLLLSIASTQHEHARELELLEELAASTDGAILILPEASGAELERAVPNGYPLAVVDPRVPVGDRIPSVAAAYRRGAYHAIEHLLALGHRRIGVISGPPGYAASVERAAGCREALADAGLTLDPDLWVEADFEIGPGAAGAAQLLDVADPPTAIFGCNDPIACGALRAARERGLRVPEDVSIVGFDDFPLAAATTPALTTIRQPMAEIGRAGVGLIVRQLGGRQSRGPQLELPTRLIVRESTGPAPARREPER